jgi:SAM-dependent methyltransferase
MLELAQARCRDLPWVELRKGSIQHLDEADGLFDALACAQVLLYVKDVAAALAEMHRVLKPGGRLVIVETDWRSCVLNSSDFALTEAMIGAWDDAVASPNLPVSLMPLLRSQGFNAVGVEPVPVLNTSLLEDGYSIDIIGWFARKAIEQRRASESQAQHWLEDLYEKSRRGEYFFCVNRFLFSAVK